jgi:hypothetical protein
VSLNLRHRGSERFFFAFYHRSAKKLLHCIRIQNMNSVFEFKPRKCGFSRGGCNASG